MFPFHSCISRSSLQEVFLGKGVLKICSKFTGEQPCQSVISVASLIGTLIKFSSYYIVNCHVINFYYKSGKHVSMKLDPCSC